MKQYIYLPLLLWSVMTATAQDTFYDHLSFGTYAVHFSDTVLFDEAISYNQYGYTGSAPLFVQVWYPATQGKKAQTLLLGEFTTNRVPQLAETYRQLTAHMDDILIRDGLSDDIATGEPLNFGNLTKQDALKMLKSMPTRSMRAQLPATLDFPVIVYHHGSQGLSYENSIMAEYFASHGYVFISSNFHLPYENTLYGLLPYEMEKSSKHDQSSAKAVISWAKALAPTNPLFFIGHSWGAQEGWCFLHDASLADAFVSMETTIEYKSDPDKIKDMWPYVYDALKVKKNTFSIPILLFAANDPSLNFDFFTGVSSAAMHYASYQAPFAHNSYTSLYMMRYFLHDKLPQTDAEVMRTQVKGYAAHVQLIHAFLEAVRKETPLDTARFEGDFRLD